VSIKEESLSSQCRVDGPSQNSCQIEQKSWSSGYCEKLGVMVMPSLVACIVFI